MWKQSPVAEYYVLLRDVNKELWTHLLLPVYEWVLLGTYLNYLDGLKVCKEFGENQKMQRMF